MEKSEKRKRQRNEAWKPSNLPFDVEYNDHFETPEIAYKDILPLLDFLENNRGEHTLYDPFYCDGRTAVLLNRLGFPKVIHQCRDFYKDVDNGTVPVHDTFITNPPYSHDHKERCVTFALEQLRTNGRNFFILMPNYVAARDHFRRLLHAHPEAGVVYVVPSTSYEYDHPEGTGHETSPFDSMWYCGLGADRVADAEKCWKAYDWDESDDSRSGRPRLITSLDELERLKLIPTEKRPNPRQRRKRRKQMQASGTGSTAPCETRKNTTSKPTSGKKKSRYRNEKGERRRRRF